eukprot:scaffold169014_cov31-Prasinocladus_malaysianus.AAC.2
MEAACEAARHGNLAYFENLDQSKLRGLVKQVDEDGRSLLHNAVSGGSTGVFNYILGLGASCNTADDEV